MKKHNIEMFKQDHQYRYHVTYPVSNLADHVRDVVLPLALSFGYDYDTIDVELDTHHLPSDLTTPWFVDTQDQPPLTSTVSFNWGHVMVNSTVKTPLLLLAQMERKHGI